MSILKSSSSLYLFAVGIIYISQYDRTCTCIFFAACRDSTYQLCQRRPRISSETADIGKARERSATWVGCFRGRQARKSSWWQVVHYRINAVIPMCVATGSDSRMRRVESSNKTTAAFCTTYNCIPYGVQFVLIIISEYTRKITIYAQNTKRPPGPGDRTCSR